MPAGTIRIGTRDSTLALWQARWVADRLRAELPDHAIELIPITTRGDVHTGPFTGSRAEIGFFTSEIETALMEDRVDIAVHSLKDLPTIEASRLPVLAVPLRHDAADVLVARDGLSLDGLPDGARVGTSSPRRTCLVRSLRPDVRIAPLRGNVDTRVAKVERGEYDAIVLAAAGLVRLGLEHVITERFDPSVFPPAPGQGALAVQATGVAAGVRGDDGWRGPGPGVQRDGGASPLTAALARVDDPEARRATDAERACLAALGGGCARPIGAYATISGGRVGLSAFVGSENGARIFRASGVGDDPGAVGRMVAQELRARGAEELLA